MEHDGRLLALLCGIDEYGGVIGDLRGCVNDVEDVRTLLLDVYAARPELITVLRNAEATRPAIESALDAMIDSAVAGDHVYVHLAGHGSSIPDRDGDEPDGRDEIFCTAAHDWHAPLSDDRVRELLDRAGPGVSVTFVADSCHSGSITRSEMATATRFAPWPRGTFPEGGGRRRRPRPSPSTSGDAGVVIVGQNEVVFTACAPDQRAAEITFDGHVRGAFTHAFVTVVRRAGGVISHRDLHVQVGHQLRMRGLRQTPQLEAGNDALDRMFLSADESRR